MRILFARHAESQANILQEISNRGLKHGLTHQGRQQAEALAVRLQEQGITHISCSPLLRAIETCVLVANRLGVELRGGGRPARIRLRRAGRAIHTADLARLARPV